MRYQLLLASTLAALVVGDAGAHVVFNEDAADAGAFHTAQLRVMHGCDGSPTNSVTVAIPDGVTRVTPRALAGWDVTVETKRLDTPIMLHGFEVTEATASVTWSGGSFPDFSYEQFEIRMMTPGEPGRRLDFPVRQKCAKGSLDWDDIAAAQDDPWKLEEPAPFIRLKPANAKVKP